MLQSDDGMTGIGQRARPSPAGAKIPPSKLKGKEFPKVKKLQKFSVPAVPLPPPGCALVPAALLHQLQSEVGKTALPVLRQEAPEVQDTAAQAARKEPEALPHLDPHQSHPHPTHPAPVAAKAPKPLRPKDGGARPIVIVKHAGVSTEDSVDGPPPPPGARHASVGTVDAVEEGTQTTPEGSVQPVPAEAAAAAAPSAPPSVSVAAPSGPGPNTGDKNKAESWQHPQPVITPIGMAAFSGFAQPGSPDQMNSTDHGRFDLFGMDKFTAEKDRDRKRLQAQMLAEQIQEQRERKEEELRRKRDEEMREERRLARELREIEERHRHEQAVLSGQADAQNEPTPKVPPGRTHGHGQVRRRKSSKDLACESPGANSYTHLRADSSAGPWVDGDERRRRRPRRRRREVESNGLVQDGSWQASERDKRTWRDANLSHSMLPERDTHSQSPVPWLTASPQDNGDHPDGLQTVLETEEMQRTEARRRRRRAERTSDRRELRERGDSYDANDTWESAPNRSHDQDMRARAAVAASWIREEEEARRGGRVPVKRGEQLAAVAEVPTAESPRQQKANQPAAASDADLREQIQSLVKVCEQLLRERAEERGNRNPKGTPAGGASPNRKTQERPERQSPSPRRLPAVSKQELIEDAPRTGMSGALGSARGASQASKASRNPTSTDWRTNQAQAPDAGSPATGGASDMHTWGEKPPEAAQPSASGSSSVHPADSLSELLQGQSRMIAGSEIPEAYAVSYHNTPFSGMPQATPAAVAPVGHHGRVGRPAMGALVEESPFASPARGIAVRRSSRSYRRDSGGGVGWGGRMLASPPLISRGGLNVQANWEPLGLAEGGGHPFHKGSRRSRGPGQVPIGINPSIQAQSAMLREMYPNVAMGGPGPGPLARG